MLRAGFVWSRAAAVVTVWVWAAASQAAVTVDVAPGFGGSAREFAWTPIAVKLTNPDDRPIQGALSVREPGTPRRDLPSCGAVVDLPARSTKLYHVYTRPSGLADISVVLNTREGRVVRKTGLNLVGESQALVVSIGPPASRLSFLTGQNVFWTPPKAGLLDSREVSAAWLAPSLLPDRPAAYEGADVIVLADASPTSVSPRALEALAAWVASGGTLVVSTGPDFQRFDHPFYEDLLPVTITGAAEIPGAKSLARMGGAAFPQGPLSVCRSEVKPAIGRVLVEEAGVPLLVERDYGGGIVVFAAVDLFGPPFRDWNGQTRFYAKLLSSTGRGSMTRSIGRAALPPSELRNPWGKVSRYTQTGLANMVAQDPSMQVPSFRAVGLFLLSYLVALVPLNHAVLKRRRRLDLAWLTTLAIVIVFSLGAYALGYVVRGGRLRIREATVIEAGSDCRAARVFTCASLLSPRRRSYNVLVDDPRTLAQMIVTDENENAPEAFAAEQYAITRVGAPMWSNRVFESTSGVDLGGVLHSDLAISGSRVSGIVVNKTNVDLEDALVVYGGAEAPLGRLAKGASARVDIAARLAPGGRTAYEADEDIARAARAYAEELGCRAGVPTLIARPTSERPVFSLEGRSPSRESATTYLFRLSCKAGGPFVISPDVIIGRITENNSVYVDGRSRYDDEMTVLSGTVLRFANNASVVISYEAPVPSDGVIETVEVNVQKEGPAAGGAFVVKALNNTTGKWDEVGPAGTCRISNPDPYLSPNGNMRVIVKSTRGNDTLCTIAVTAWGKRI